MIQSWSNWKRFPDVKSGDRVEAPVGPGVYEVRHTMTGRLMAFGHSGNVAHTIAELKLDVGVGPFARLFGRAAAGVARRRSRIPHLRGGKPRRRPHRARTADGPAADRLETPHGSGLGGAPSELSFMR